MHSCFAYEAGEEFVGAGTAAESEISGLTVAKGAEIA